MSIRTDTIRHLLERWLTRYSPPQAIKDKPEALQDELLALLRVLLRFAPREDYEGWVNEALDRCAYQMKTRAWPTQGEIGSVCSNLRKERPSGSAAPVAPLDPAEMAAKRMSAGSDVSEGWLYGRDAVELIARGLVGHDTMTRYRSAAFFARKDLYSEEAALRWESEARERHEAGKELWRSRNEERHQRDVAAYIGGAAHA